MQRYGFSAICIFTYMFLDSVHIRENLAYRKPLYLHILFSVQVRLWVNLCTTFCSFAPAKFCVQVAALCRTGILKNYFLLYTINEWKKLDTESGRIDSYVGFWNKLLSFIKPTEIKTFIDYDPLGIKLLDRLRVDFSYLKDQKRTLCSCSLETEKSTSLFF